MIGYLKGTVQHVDEKDIVVLTQGGTGYLVNIAPSQISGITEGEEIELFIETSVREDAIVLFGFKRQEEKKLFNLLREVNKVGPKTALAIIASGTTGEITSSIVSGNSKFFSNVSGVGAKTAERIIIDLKDKVGNLPVDTSYSVRSEEQREVIDAKDGLAALGYNPIQIRNAISKIENKDNKKAEDIVREALRVIDGKR
jgi:holliday junction DNA helicase RuvA